MCPLASSFALVPHLLDAPEPPSKFKLILGCLERVWCRLLRSMILASVSLSVCHAALLCKHGWIDWGPVWGKTLGDPTNVVLDGESIPPMVRGKGIRCGLRHNTLASYSLNRNITTVLSRCHRIELSTPHETTQLDFFNIKGILQKTKLNLTKQRSVNTPNTTTTQQ